MAKTSRDKYVFRCIAYPTTDGFVSLCIDLDIASCGDSLEQAINGLNEQIKEYIAYARESGRFEELVPRPSPLLAKFKYHLLVFLFRILKTIRRGRDNRNRLLRGWVELIPRLA